MSLRAILKVNSRYSTEWLGVSRAKSCCIETYKLLNDIGPISLCKEIEKYEPKRCLCSAGQLNLKKHKCNTKFAEGDMIVRGERYWDMLDTNIKSADSLKIFKNTIKTCDNFYIPAFTNYGNVYYM